MMNFNLKNKQNKYFKSLLAKLKNYHYLTLTLKYKIVDIQNSFFEWSAILLIPTIILISFLSIMIPFLSLLDCILNTEWLIDHYLTTYETTKLFCSNKSEFEFDSFDIINNNFSYNIILNDNKYYHSLYFKKKNILNNKVILRNPVIQMWEAYRRGPWNIKIINIGFQETINKTYKTLMSAFDSVYNPLKSRDSLLSNKKGPLTEQEKNKIKLERYQNNVRNYILYHKKSIIFETLYDTKEPNYLRAKWVWGEFWPIVYGLHHIIKFTQNTWHFLDSFFSISNTFQRTLDMTKFNDFLFNLTRTNKNFYVYDSPIYKKGRKPISQDLPNKHPFYFTIRKRIITFYKPLDLTASKISKEQFDKFTKEERTLYDKAKKEQNRTFYKWQHIYPGKSKIKRTSSKFNISTDLSCPYNMSKSFNVNKKVPGTIWSFYDKNIMNLLPLYFRSQSEDFFIRINFYINFVEQGVKLWNYAWLFDWPTNKVTYAKLLIEVMRGFEKWYDEANPIELRKFYDYAENHKRTALRFQKMLRERIQYLDNSEVKKIDLNILFLTLRFRQKEFDSWVIVYPFRPWFDPRHRVLHTGDWGIDYTNFINKIKRREKIADNEIKNYYNKELNHNWVTLFKSCLPIKKSYLDFIAQDYNLEKEKTNIAVWIKKNNRDEVYRVCRQVWDMIDKYRYVYRARVADYIKLKIDKIEYRERYIYPKRVHRLREKIANQILAGISQEQPEKRNRLNHVCIHEDLIKWGDNQMKFFDNFGWYSYKKILEKEKTIAHFDSLFEYHLAGIKGELAIGLQVNSKIYEEAYDHEVKSAREYFLEESKKSDENALNYELYLYGFFKEASYETIGPNNTVMLHSTVKKFFPAYPGDRNSFIVRNPGVLDFDYKKLRKYIGNILYHQWYIDQTNARNYTELSEACSFRYRWNVLGSVRWGLHTRTSDYDHTPNYFWFYPKPLSWHRTWNPLYTPVTSLKQTPYIKPEHSARLIPDYITQERINERKVFWKDYIEEEYAKFDELEARSFIPKVKDNKTNQIRYLFDNNEDQWNKFWDVNNRPWRYGKSMERYFRPTKYLNTHFLEHAPGDFLENLEKARKNPVIAYLPRPMSLFVWTASDDYRTIIKESPQTPESPYRVYESCFDRH